MAEDISLADGKKISDEAAKWNATPYKLIGATSMKGVGGDCSGSTYKIYQAAGFPFEYQTASQFREHAAASGLFREVGAGEAKQDGDILSWSSHMAIYSSFSTPSQAAYATTSRMNARGQKWIQRNDMWTATHVGGGPYEPFLSKYWSSTSPKVFRRVR